MKFYKIVEACDADIFDQRILGLYVEKDSILEYTVYIIGKASSLSKIIIHSYMDVLK